MLSLLLLLLLYSQAAEPPVDAPGADTEQADPDAAARAEYIRLSRSMQKLATKDHWDGVDHAYAKALATGVALSFQDHMTGAQASLARGDIGTARSRLLDAKAVQDDDPEVIEGLWAIDTGFAEVTLQAAPSAELEPTQMPFNQLYVRAIGFARASLEKEGIFQGYLPAGDYRLGGQGFKLVVREIGSEPFSLDVRSEKQRKKDRKAPRDG
jgi:hypothetical protein